MTKYQIITLFTAGLGSIGTGLGGTYVLGKSEISNFIDIDLLDTDKNTEDWKSLKKSLKDGEISSSNQRLDEIKKSSEDTANDLSEWCKNQKLIKYSYLFLLPSQKNLLKDVKKYCSITFGNKIGEKKFNTQNDTDKENIKTKLEALKSHSDVNGKLEESSDWKELKDKYTDNKEDNWQHLRNLCEKIYENGFVNEESNNWKLAKHYCSKG